MLPEYESPEVLVRRNRVRGYQHCRVGLHPGPSQGPALLLFKNYAIKTRLFYSITMARHWEKAENREKASCPRATIVASGIGRRQDCGSTVGRGPVEMEAPPPPRPCPGGHCCPRPSALPRLKKAPAATGVFCGWFLLPAKTPRPQGPSVLNPLPRAWNLCTHSSSSGRSCQTRQPLCPSLTPLGKTFFSGTPLLGPEPPSGC